MMGGGASLRQGGAQDSPPGWAGKDPGGASSPRSLGAGWTKMAASQIALVCLAATPHCVCVCTCVCVRVCVFAFPSLVFAATFVLQQRYLPAFSHFHFYLPRPALGRLQPGPRAEPRRVIMGVAETRRCVLSRMAWLPERQAFSAFSRSLVAIFRALAV